MILTHGKQDEYHLLRTFNSLRKAFWLKILKIERILYKIANSAKNQIVNAYTNVSQKNRTIPFKADLEIKN